MIVSMRLKVYKKTDFIFLYLFRGWNTQGKGMPEMKKRGFYCVFVWFSEKK